MSSSGIPQDLVAIFHTSFHPTKGNVIDWSLKANEDFDLEGVEFSTLPSGLHLVPQDVVYFTKGNHRGVCIFRRRETTEQGHRGFRLSSLGILLAKSARPCPWRHVPDLKTLIHSIYEGTGDSGVLEPTESDWELARTFFDERRLNTANIERAGGWNGWSHELDGPDSDPTEPNPTLHLPHLLRILGPSALTLYKHILGRRRILIYTLPPVEAACILCQVAADMCYEDQVNYQSENDAQYHERPKGKCKEGINVLGMVTLSDMDKLHNEGHSGRGWIACTTDAIFLEKPSCYDLIIDFTMTKATRPTLYVSRPLQLHPGARGPSHRLTTIRWTWSDVKLWNELDRLLRLDASDPGACCDVSNAKTKALSAWTDGWGVYDDACIFCAGLWIGSWRGNSSPSYSNGNGVNWGSVRLEGDDDLSVGMPYVRNLGMGIEGRPESGASSTPPKPHSSGMSWSSGKSTGVKVNPRQVLSSSILNLDARTELAERRDRQVLTTLALLQTFHANTCFQLSRLASFLPPGSAVSSPEVVSLSPKDITSFDLGPLSSFDGRYLQWLADEYGCGIRVEIRRGGWRDWVSIILGI